MDRRVASFWKVTVRVLGQRLSSSSGVAFGASAVQLAAIALLTLACGGIAAPVPVLAWAAVAALLSAILPIAQRWNAAARASAILTVASGASWAIGLPLTGVFLSDTPGLAGILLAGATVSLCALQARLNSAVATLHVTMVTGGMALALWQAIGAAATGALGLVALLAACIIAASLRLSARIRMAQADQQRAMEQVRALERLISELETTMNDGAALSFPRQDEGDQLTDRVRRLIHRDPVTGLLNRQRFLHCISERVGPKASATRSPALLHLDLDKFNALNDVHGTEIGDRVLRQAGLRVRQHSREGDVVARLDGNAIAVLLDATAGDGMLIERAHRLLAALREPFEIEGRVLQLTTSIGIARAPQNGDGAELLRRADLALHAAKAKGRDQMAFFDEAIDRRARERGLLENELREAVAQDQLVLHYQPIVALVGGATVGYEALLRWRHPIRGLLLPDAFLPVAEASGLIVDLGDWVIRRALAEVAYWPGDFRLSINLSPTQTRHPMLIATVDSALAASGFDAGRLEFEITEHVLLRDDGAGMAILERLRALGVDIALDDFGTGYSSLSYLRRFRFDRIKIDRCFVRDIETCDEAQAIVSAITRLAQALGMKTTAEGVENAKQLDMLRKLGCDEAQGFLILQPAEAQMIEAARVDGNISPPAASKSGKGPAPLRAVKPRQGTVT